MRRRIVVLAVAAALAVGGTVLGLRLTRSSAPDQLAGGWKDAAGSVIRFEVGAPDEWSPVQSETPIPRGTVGWLGELVTNGAETCNYVGVDLTGSNDHYHGYYAYYRPSTSGFCGPLTYEPITVTVGPDGTTLAVATHAAAGSCVVCGHDVWTRQQVTPATTADPLTGDWLDAGGGLYLLVPVGDHMWFLHFLDNARINTCMSPQLLITGANGRYRGEYGFYRDNGTSCFPYEGVGALTIAVDPGGRSLRITTTAPAHTACSLCGTFVWTKKTASST
jgi:hypothetical protein